MCQENVFDLHIGVDLAAERLQGRTGKMVSSSSVVLEILLTRPADTLHCTILHREANGIDS